MLSKGGWQIQVGLDQKLMYLGSHCRRPLHLLLHYCSQSVSDRAAFITVAAQHGEPLLCWQSFTLRRCRCQSSVISSTALISKDPAMWEVSKVYSDLRLDLWCLILKPAVTLPFCRYNLRSDRTDLKICFLKSCNKCTGLVWRPDIYASYPAGLAK